MSGDCRSHRSYCRFSGKFSWLRNDVTLTEKFLNYKRGIPTKEIDADLNELNRIVNTDGTIASETDRNGKTVGYPTGGSLRAIQRAIV